MEEPPLTLAPRSPKKLLLVPHVPRQSGDLYEAPWVHPATSQGLRETTQVPELSLDLEEPKFWLWIQYY